MSPEEIRAELAQLRAAGEALRARSLTDTLDAVARVFDLWNDPASEARRALAGTLPGATGFSPAVVVAGLERGLAGWTYDAAIALFESELGPISALEAADARRTIGGFPVTATILAGSIPMPSLLAILAPLLLRSPVLVKPGARDPLTAKLVRESILSIDAGLGSCVALAPFRSGADDGGHLEALAEADCVVATGSDQAVRRIAAAVAPPRRLVGYGHRLSLAALGPEALQGGALAAAAEALSVDIALWDQSGCLSPIALLVAGDTDQAAGVAAHVASALESREKEWPRGEVEPSAAAQIAHEHSEAELRAAAVGRGTVFGGPDARFSVVAEADARPRPAPLHRFLRIHPCGDAAGVHAAAAAYGPHLAAVGLEGFGGNTSALARSLAGVGASRVCPLGSLQSPPLAWRHDNRGVLEPLARAADLEVP